MRNLRTVLVVLGLGVCSSAGELCAEITGDGTGLQPTGVVCRNLTTGQKVISTTSGLAWDCGALGLSFSPGDSVETGLRGSVPLEEGALVFDARASPLPLDFAPNAISTEGGGDFLLGDLDGDGDADVVDAGGPFQWFENLGGATPTFEPHPLDHLLVVGNAVSGMRLLDADGDGQLDIVAANLFSAAARQLSLFRNNGGTPPTFSRLEVSKEFPWTFPWGGRGADVDGDGDIDFYAARAELNCAPSCTLELVWFENTGNDEYRRHVIANDKLGDLAPLDVDLDGDLDVVMSSSSELSWFENDGASFPQEHLIPRTEWAIPLKSADLNGDGLEDLLAQADEVVFWYANLGDGSFAEHVLHTFASFPFAFSMPVADFSGDGRLDVLLGSEDAPVWLENLGGSPLSFREHSLLEVFNGSNSTRVGSGTGDIDNDGRPDFVADTETFDWYRNQIGRRLVVGGLSVRGFLCRNRTTGQTVRVPTTDASIDCENEGLAASSGDEVEVFARGRAQ